MKNIWKQTLLSVLVLGVGVLTSCREDEELNLPGYPENPVGITIADAENAAEVTVKGTYEAGTGALLLDGALTRTYVFSLATPSPEDVTFQIEPIIENIPEDRVSISETELFIPAGGISASVTVGLVDDDHSFMEGVYDAQNYTLGVRLTGAEGSQLVLLQTEAKLHIEKEAYTMTASVVGTDGSRAALFERSCLDGEIVTEEPIEYAYKVVLDKPALTDLTFRMVSSGTPEDYKSYESFSAQTVTIAAGELESEPATWRAEDDFLEGNDDPATYTIALTAESEAADSSVIFSEEASSCLVTITKTFDRLIFLDALDPSWVRFDTTGWTTDPASIGDQLFDDNDVTFSTDRSIVIDMKKEKSIAGFRVRAYYGYSFYLPSVYSISTSNDGEVWASQGELTSSEAPTETHYVALIREVKARYVRFDVIEVNWSCYLAEFNIYGKN